MDNINIKAALFRFLSGLGIFLLESVRGYLTGADFSEFGPWAAIAGVVATGLVTVIGMLIKKFGAKAPA